MTANQSARPPQDQDRSLTITRTFNAPPELVWRAWTEPDRIAKWWGPKGFSTRVVSQDLRPGGRWRYVMTGPDGTEYPVSGVFLDVVPFERIVTTDEFDEGFEQIVGHDLPNGIVMSVQFQDVPGGTHLTLHISHATPEDRQRHEQMGVVQGWNSSLDCFEEHLAASAAS